MNIISFDIEEWYLEQTYYEGNILSYQAFDRCLKKILDELFENNIKATFFCLGKIASDFPEIIKTISDNDHEIGCHSNEHKWLNKLSYKELLSDTTVAIHELENVSGKKVLSYRAPAFSIGESNSWAFEILAECGITRDSSVFPAKRDYGGFSTFSSNNPVLIHYQGYTIKEFPINPTKFFSKNIAFSGGGYFRLFPYWFIKNNTESHDYNIFYFHIADLIPGKHAMMSKQEYENYFKENGSILNRAKRYLKSQYGTKNTHHKMNNLLKDFEFINLEDADHSIDWSKINIADLMPYDSNV